MKVLFAPVVLVVHALPPIKVFQVAAAFVNGLAFKPTETFEPFGEAVVIPYKTLVCAELFTNPIKSVRPTIKKKLFCFHKILFLMLL
ncbi:hypothetical protein [Flavobacterium sedimenticola]|uniref:Secreted protein n=1 Tax=Flavobacterium sedimenticola TaxID=3043286 RepID=A0ABT6XTU1_9FLAO|nr:hypothetical protein [Flavobacterium sedimenticola]MDI9258523.1 hypothetical protein [Flavobacterium sedimenticola]